MLANQLEQVRPAMPGDHELDDVPVQLEAPIHADEEHQREVEIEEIDQIQGEKSVHATCCNDPPPALSMPVDHEVEFVGWVE